VYWALGNAAIIGVYTLIDGAGARASGNALSYVVYLTFLEGVFFLAWLRWRRGAPAVTYIARQWRRGLLGGLLQRGCVRHRAVGDDPCADRRGVALRETSVLFAAIIGSFLLKEGFGIARLVGAASVVAGVAALKL
jgi:drug/metabolite transporter (DMT)-like permease